MGSFNETCALSGLIIRPNDPVKILFLTRNPYANYSRGFCYNDYWFLRTPPISGTYDDYGKTSFEESYLTRLIEYVFSIDVVEQPFGFNKCHSHPTPKNPTIYQLLDLASQGRLLIKDDKYYKSVAESYEQQKKMLGQSLEKKKKYPHFPTWKKILKLLAIAKMPIMSKENDKGYNAQKVGDGVVVVDFNDYSNNQKKLEKAAKILQKYYDCKLVYQEFYRGKNLIKIDPCLMVVAKNAFDDPSVLLEPTFDKLKKEINTHPEHIIKKGRKLHVSSVMVRQDVWDLYCNVKYAPWSKNRDTSLAGFEKTLDEIMKVSSDDYKNTKDSPHAIDLLKNLKFQRFREIFPQLPFQIAVGEHLEFAYELLEKGKIAPENIKDLSRLCCETARVEYVMMNSCQPWQVTITGGQKDHFKLKLEINKGINQIIKNEIKKNKENE